MFFKFLYPLICLLLFSFSLFSEESSKLLQSSDVSRIMQQILDQHVDQKNINQKILKNAFKIYIDQFDPNRVYLLEEEVKPFLELQGSDLSKILIQYNQNDFSSFLKLNKVIQKSIERARNLRAELERNPEQFFEEQYNGITVHEKWADPNLQRPFAKNSIELKNRLQEQLIQYIQSDKRRFGAAQILRNKNQVIVLYEKQTRNLENQYLGTDEEGQSLSEEKQENLFILHVLKALASSLDAHTTFYNAQEAYEMRVRLEKEFDGIGVVLQQTSNGISISKIINQSPAAKSGLIKVNDLIVEIDGRSINGESFEKVNEMLRGKNNTSVSLVLKRSVQEGNKTSQKLFNVKLKRELIPLNEDRVDISYESFANGIIGKITLHSFYQGVNGINSVNDVLNAIKKLDQLGNLRGLILDLRENSGGFLSQAVKVAGLFITNGIIVISKYSNGEQRIYRDVDGNTYYRGPLVVLTSKATASAAEIVAQALQDYGVAIVVGDEHTYGKGTIQSQTVTNPQGSSFFKVTVGKYYTVSGKTPQIQGVHSDIIVKSQFSNEHIGEEYLDYSLKPDTIIAEYDDSLSDVDPSVKSWYLHYYIPTLQPQIGYWKEMLPTLKKNSEYRLTHNKNYQMFLKILKGENTVEEEDLLGIQTQHNFGAEDLQMIEAVNIVKDMIYLDAHNRNRSSHLETTSSLEPNQKELEIPMEKMLK